MKKKYFIAVDFDGTLCENVFPDIGAPINRVLKRLESRISHLAHAGHDVVLLLWTCREDVPERAYLTEAVEWCKAQGLNFDAVNHNPHFNFNRPDLVRKLYADEYWDDRAINPLKED